MRPSPPTHPSSQPSPHSQPPPPHSQMMSSQPFMGPRYPAGPRPGVRMPQIGSDFNGVSVLINVISLSLSRFLSTSFYLLYSLLYSPLLSCACAFTCFVIIIISVYTLDAFCVLLSSAFVYIVLLAVRASAINLLTIQWLCLQPPGQPMMQNNMDPTRQGRFRVILLFKFSLAQSIRDDNHEKKFLLIIDIKHLIIFCLVLLLVL